MKNDDDEKFLLVEGAWRQELIYRKSDGRFIGKLSSVVEGFKLTLNINRFSCDEIYLTREQAIERIKWLMDKNIETWL